MKTPEELQQEFETLFKKIRDFVGNGNYIFRGEAKEYSEVSSTLYREVTEYMEPGKFNMKAMQEENLRIAKRYTKEKDDDRILEEIQHLGGSTNQIDFTTDYLVALFFACDGEPKSNGKLIFLDKREFKGEIHEPRYPQNRVIAQKSVFVRSSSGLVKPDKIIPINMELKELVLRYLAQHHDINAHTIYNDIHGYITRSEIHKTAHENFYKGLIFQEKGDNDSAITHYIKALEHDPIFEDAYNNLGIAYDDKEDYDSAIDNYDKAIALDSNYAMAYNNRGNTYSNKENYDRAIADFNKSIDLNPNYVKAYNNRGVVYNKKGAYDLAINDFNTAIKMQPNYEIYFNRGIAKKKLQDYKGAKEDFETALQLTKQQKNKNHAAEIQNAINKLTELEK